MAPVVTMQNTETHTHPDFMVCHDRSYPCAWAQHNQPRALVSPRCLSRTDHHRHRRRLRASAKPRNCAAPPHRPSAPLQWHLSTSMVRDFALEEGMGCEGAPVSALPATVRCQTAQGGISRPGLAPNKFLNGGHAVAEQDPMLNREHRARSTAWRRSIHTPTDNVKSGRRDLCGGPRGPCCLRRS